MIDQPGPWGTGAFTLIEGFSSLENSMAVISAEPFCATHLDIAQPRSDRVVMEANPTYWNRERGPRVQRVVYRNELDPVTALDHVCDRDGEVDVLAEVAAADAARVEASDHAHLVAHDAMRLLVGMINRDAAGAPLHDVRARQALNMALNRDTLIGEAFHGYASPLAGFTPHFAAGKPNDLAPYPHDPERARQLLSEAGWPSDRPLRVAAPPELAELARYLQPVLSESLGLGVELLLPTAEEVGPQVRRLVEKKLPLPWDVHLHAWIDLSTDAPPAMIHREFVAAGGAFRSGPPVPEFDELFSAYARELRPERFNELAQRMDRLCYDQALALFLCSPQALYAVNNNVAFTAYGTTLELAETEVTAQHWSRRS